MPYPLLENTLMFLDELGKKEVLVDGGLLPVLPDSAQPAYLD
jgi:hypothetical protein